MRQPVTEVLYLCDKHKNDLCHKEGCSSSECNCKHTKHFNFAKNKKSVDIYNEFVKRFEIQSCQLSDQIFVVTFVEKEGG